MFGLKLNHVSKSGPWSPLYWANDEETTETSMMTSSHGSAVFIGGLLWGKLVQANNKENIKAAHYWHIADETSWRPYYVIVIKMSLLKTETLHELCCRWRHQTLSSWRSSFFNVCGLLSHRGSMPEKWITRNFVTKRREFLMILLFMPEISVWPILPVTYLNVHLHSLLPKCHIRVRKAWEKA